MAHGVQTESQPGLNFWSSGNLGNGRQYLGVLLLTMVPGLPGSPFSPFGPCSPCWLEAHGTGDLIMTSPSVLPAHWLHPAALTQGPPPW